jgi:hypothetical protein
VKLARDLGGDSPRELVGAASVTPARPRRWQRDVLEPWRRMTVFDPKSLDQLGGGIAVFRELLARALAQSRRERVDLANRRSHPPIEAEPV